MATNKFSYKTKLSKEEELDKRIEEIRRRNDQIIRRKMEVDADRVQAETAQRGTSYAISNAAFHRPKNDKSEMPLGCNEKVTLSRKEHSNNKWKKKGQTFEDICDKNFDLKGDSPNAIHAQDPKFDQESRRVVVDDIGNFKVTLTTSNGTDQESTGHPNNTMKMPSPVKQRVALLSKKVKNKPNERCRFKQKKTQLPSCETQNSKTKENKASEISDGKNVVDAQRDESEEAKYEVVKDKIEEKCEGMGTTCQKSDPRDTFDQIEKEMIDNLSANVKISDALLEESDDDLDAFLAGNYLLFTRKFYCQHQLEADIADCLYALVDKVSAADHFA